MNILLDLNSVAVKKRNNFGALDHLINPLEKLGHHVVRATEYDNPDAVFAFGTYTPNNHTKGRNMCIEKWRSRNTKLVCVDIGVFQQFSSNTINEQTLRFSLNCSTGQGEYLINVHKNDTRLESLKKKYKFDIDFPITNKEDILLVLQSSHGWTFDVHDEFDWTSKIIDDIRKYTNAKVVIKAHPVHSKSKANIVKLNNLKKIKKNIEILDLGNNRTPFLDIVRDYKCIITHSSSASFNAYVKGVPVICTSSRCINHENYFRQISDLKNLHQFPWDHRQQALNNWAHTSWSIEELKDNPEIFNKYINS